MTGRCSRTSPGAVAERIRLHRHPGRLRHRCAPMQTPEIDALAPACIEVFHYKAVLAEPFPPLVDGRLALTEAPGLGVAPDLAAAKPFLIQRSEHRM